VRAERGGSAEGGGLSYRGAQGVDPKRLEQIKALYGFDKPAHRALHCRCWASSPRSTWAQLLPEQGRVELIVEKLPVSISLGLWTFFISYLWPCRWAWPRRCGRARGLTW
jgi:microcin C transport system permease protein